MELIEFFYGVILTIIGVVVVEYCIFYFKEKKVIDNLKKSVGYEVTENLGISMENFKKIRSRKTEGYIPFETISYYTFKQSMSDKLIKNLGKESITSLFIGYIYCINFNNNLHLSLREDKHTAKNELAECLKKIDTNFKEFQRLEKI